MKETGERLYRLRVVARLSRAALAKKSGISATSIQRIEAGRDMTVDTARALAKGLGVSVAELTIENPASHPTSGNSRERGGVSAATPTASAEPGRPVHGVPLLMADELHQWDWSDPALLAKITDARGLTDSTDPGAFFVIADTPELSGSSIPHASHVLIEPSEEVREGRFVLVKSPAGPVIRRYAVVNGHPELRELHPDQTRVEYVHGLRMLVVASFTVQLK